MRRSTRASEPRLAALTREELHAEHALLPFDYAKYVAWTRDKDAAPFAAFGTTTAKLRPRAEWATKGREIWVEADVADHAKKVAMVLRKNGLEHFLIELQKSDVAWFPARVAEQPGAIEKRRYLEEKAGPRDYAAFDGGFQLDFELSSFLMTFIDYTWRFRHRTVEMLSEEKPLVLQVGKFLDVLFVSSDAALLEKLERDCEDLGLTLLLPGGVWA